MRAISVTPVVGTTSPSGVRAAQTVSESPAGRNAENTTSAMQNAATVRRWRIFTH